MTPPSEPRAAPIEIGGVSVTAGERRALEIPVGRLPSGTFLSLPLEVVHGSSNGPTVWLSGAIHGDEIVGVEIIRRVLDELDPAELSGTILAAPVVNVFGFVFESRYLPDRRDLNRSFPGSKRGSLASRLARLFLDEVVSRCDVGIDFHAGSDDRTNLPQLRGNMRDQETQRIAGAFAPPIIIHAKPVKGSLRSAALKMGKRVLLFEGGEPRRFSEHAVEVGVVGALRALDAVGVSAMGTPRPDYDAVWSASTSWLRASRGGIFHLDTALGARVERGEGVGIITDPLVRDGTLVLAKRSGIVIGHTVNPLVNLGDAIVHVATVTDREQI